MSSTPVAVTVCAVLQAAAAKVRVVEAAGAPPPADTSPSPSSRLATDTVTASEGCVRSATVKVDCPPASVAWPVTALTSSPYSSSRIVSVASDGAATPRPPAAVADTVTDFIPEAKASSFAVTVTRPALVVEPAAIVKVVAVLKVKSAATAFAPAAAATVNVVAALVGCERVAVTVDTSPFSRIEDGVRTSVAVAVASSSSKVSVTFGGAATPLPPDAVPETVTDLFGESSTFPFAVTVTTPALVVAPAAMVRVVAVLEVKSAPTAPAPAAAATVTVTAALDGPESVAVTVEIPPVSEIDAGPRTSATVGSVSSSVKVSAAPVTVSAPWPLVSAAVTVTLRPALPW